MGKRGYLLIGIGAFLVFAVVLLPARVVLAGRQSGDSLVLTDVEGTVWNGAAHTAYRGTDTGRLAWRFRPLALFVGEVGAHWELAGDAHRLIGDVVYDGGRPELTAEGEVGALFVNRLLAPYRISVEGDVAVDAVTVLVDETLPSGLDVAGRLRWAGGRTRYRLSGRNYDITLPAMLGTLATQQGSPTFQLSSAPDGTLLMDMSLDSEGWLHIGITRRLLALAGKSWRGQRQGGDDEVVIAVSEKVL